jgi:2-C-methyl-D-erythritol 4-phosphate cytidylyltransferase
MKYSVIILAAGSGKRTGLNHNKILQKIKGKRVIDFSLDFFKNDINCHEIILVSSKIDYDYFSSEFKQSNIKVVLGGLTRTDSVRFALNKAVNEYILIHDGARPFFNSDSVSNLLNILEKNDSVTLGVRVKETIQEIDGDNIIKTLDRSNLIITQTPQGFKKDLLLKAHNLALKDGYSGTDDTVLLEKYLNIKAKFVFGDYRNMKLTTIEDIKLLEVIL